MGGWGWAVPGGRLLEGEVIREKYQNRFRYLCNKQTNFGKMNIGTFSKATLRKLLRDRVARVIL